MEESRLLSNMWQTCGRRCFTSPLPAMLSLKCPIEFLPLFSPLCEILNINFSRLVADNLFRPVLCASQGRMTVSSILRLLNDWNSYHNIPHVIMMPAIIARTRGLASSLRYLAGKVGHRDSRSTVTSDALHTVTAVHGPGLGRWLIQPFILETNNV